MVTPLGENGEVSGVHRWQQASCRRRAESRLELDDMYPVARTLERFALLRTGVAVLLGWGAPGAAQAYCTLRTCQEVTPTQAAESGGELDPNECDKEGICIVEGQEMYWGSACLSYGVSPLNTSALGLTAEEFHGIVEEAYDVWATVECPGGGHPNFEVGSVGIVDSNGAFFCEDEPLANISVWSIVNRWTRDPRAFGYTAIGHYVEDGEILDADVELNLNKIEAEHQGDYGTLLSYVAVHEAGHYLGLAHSSDVSAVMFEFYDPEVQSSPTLTPDDIDGICKLYPPKDELDCSEPGYVQAGLDAQACKEAAPDPARDAAKTESGCSIVSVGQRAHCVWSTAGLVCVVAVGVRRKRAVRPIAGAATANRIR